MSAVGFDIGNENCVIAVVKQRGIDVLLNDESKRETPSVVSFGEKQRFLGSAGAGSATMNPKSTISQIKRLIGRKFRQPDVLEDLKLLPFKTSEDSNGGILVHLQYLGQVQSFSPAQILGMLLGHLKSIAEKNLEMPISDCVIGIPSYFTDLQRREYLNAASIAGLKPLRLIHECTAIALGYGIYKNDFSNSGPTHVVFVDIGHCDTQVCVAAFENGYMKILSHGFDSNLGGRDFDEVLFRHFAAEFREKYRIDVYSNVRACIRLRAACEKVKKILSANPEAQLRIECLMEERDVKLSIMREEFEKLSSDLLDRVCVPCRKAMADSRLHVDKIHSVELVGSGSRIPAITKLIASTFGKDPRRTLNASECVARGCALQCAMLSPVFRVRDYEVQDSFPFTIGLKLDEGPICTLSNGMLFRRGQFFPSLKVVALHRTSTFHIEAFYADQNELPLSISPEINRFTIGPFQVSNPEKSKIKLRIELNLNGIVTVESASLIEDQMDDFATRGNTHPVAEQVEIESNRGSSHVVNGAKDSYPAQSRSMHMPSADEMGRGNPIKRLFIPVSENVYGGMTNAKLLEAQEKEIQLAQQDIKMEQAKDKKNALESYVYDTRNKISSTHQSFISESEKEGISRSLQQTEEWLYEDGDDESEDVYTQKLEGLKKLVDPIENRYKDEEARGQATKDLLDCIVSYRMAVGSLPATDRDAVLHECNEAEHWLRDKTQQQDSLPKTSDPVLWSSEIKRRTEALHVSCKHIMDVKPSTQGEDNAMDCDPIDKPDSKQEYMLLFLGSFFAIRITNAPSMIEFLANTEKKMQKLGLPNWDDDT
ncbi:Heat shock protein 70 family [Dillenia turbinata]|uniref:Heat shock protein 70 family n=1 Tax=Dillenia turbinata TaxID=194707 RepID=A0AAN8VLY8_9MAGN